MYAWRRDFDSLGVSLVHCKDKTISTFFSIFHRLYENLEINFVFVQKYFGYCVLQYAKVNTYNTGLLHCNRIKFFY
jgi:hypothetical protein